MHSETVKGNAAHVPAPALQDLHSEQTGVACQLKFVLFPQQPSCHLLARVVAILMRIVLQHSARKLPVCALVVL